MREARTIFEELSKALIGKIEINDNGEYIGMSRKLMEISNEVIFGTSRFQDEISLCDAIIKAFYHQFPEMLKGEYTLHALYSYNCPTNYILYRKIRDQKEYVTMFRQDEFFYEADDQEYLVEPDDYWKLLDNYIEEKIGFCPDYDLV